MSKPQNTNASPEASSKVRIESLVQLKRDFKQELPKSEEYYDRRVYFDGVYEYYPYVFSKCLPHDQTTGFVKKQDADKLIDAWKNGDKESLDAIILSEDSTRKPEGVAASQSFQMMGTDSTVYAIEGIHSVDSDEAAFEQAEVYARSLARDVSFADYSTDHPVISSLVDALDEYPQAGNTAYHPVTHANIFRGTLPGDLIGPFISQFLIQDFSYSNIIVQQKFQPEDDFASSKTWADFIDVQNGKVNGTIVKTDAKFCYNARTLGAKVHNDPLFAFYYNAALICFQNGYGPSGFSHDKTSDWTSGGGPSVLASVAHVAIGALRTAWNSKFGQAMRIRPEVYAARLNFADNPDNATIVSAVPGLSGIYSKLKGQIKTLVKGQDANNNLLLLNQFPEGSPTHPSLPAGHAVVAGACVTVLKAMLDLHDSNNDAKMWNPTAYEASADGESRIQYNGNDLTVVGELNKLASNVSYGRDFAGVHARVDGRSGIELGEKYAISYLKDVAKEYHESSSGLFQGWLLEKFDGSKVIISSSNVISVV
jgi:hypothetical protein